MCPCYVCLTYPCALCAAIGVTTYAMHDDSIWALCTNSSFTAVYTGGRDKNVFATDLNMESLRAYSESRGWAWQDVLAGSAGDSAEATPADASAAPANDE